MTRFSYSFFPVLIQPEVFYFSPFFLRVSTKVFVGENISTSNEIISKALPYHAISEDLIEIFLKNERLGLFKHHILIHYFKRYLTSGNVRYLLIFYMFT